MTFTKIGTGTIKKSSLDTNDVFILDAGFSVYAWIGLKASKKERRFALSYAQDYLTKFKRPANTCIVRVMEGGENEEFLSNLS